MTNKLHKKYLEIVTGKDKSRIQWLTAIYGEKNAR